MPRSGLAETSVPILAPVAYTFRAVVESDFPLLRRWLAAGHVRRWWGDAAKEMSEIASAVREEGVDPFIVSFDGRPLGYLQSYDLDAEWSLGVFRDQPAGTRGIDQFIGEADMVGLGHGPRFIDAMCVRLFAEAVPRVITDPDPANKRALRAYEKAGFRVLEHRTLEDGPVVLMARDRAN